MRLLLEMRPALEGHAGIPQENRLLFRALRSLPDHEVQGLLQSGGLRLQPAIPDSAGVADSTLAPHVRADALSRVVISLQPAAINERLVRKWRSLQTRMSPWEVLLKAVRRRAEALSHFDPAHFEDFIWRSLFEKSLHPTDRPLVTAGSFRVLQVPYGAMHAVGVATARLGRPAYMHLDTEGVDVFLTQTPYPGRVRAGTTLLVRYMDAVPMYLPHTIIKRSIHQASHYEALRQNVNDGAWFACASEASRQDLLSMFPQAAERAVTVHCMLSHHYFEEASARTRVPEIIAKRRHGLPGLVLPAIPAHEEPLPPYLLQVSTLEPRKNHGLLLRAWEALRARGHAGLKLVVVGSLGWEYESIVADMRPWIERGELLLLGNVPAEELRVLYRHAAVTVCPSLAEGFDYSGAEAMRCGGLVASSDLPVHREVFADGATYFDPYDMNAAAEAIERLLDPRSVDLRKGLRAAAGRITARYLPEVLVPQWASLLQRIRAVRGTRA